MKYILTVISILTFTGFGFAQISWDKANADTARGFETESDIETHNKVTFTKAGTYRWVRTYEQQCSIKTAICDKNSCYLETTDSADFTVDENESFDMICHFYPYNTCCPDGATVTLYVFKIDEPSVNSTATYTLDLWCKSASVGDVSDLNFNIYPNPANDKINISGDLDQIQQVEITGISGNVISTSSLDNNTVDVSGLTAGVYFVAIRTESGVYTQRFIKN